MQASNLGRILVSWTAVAGHRLGFLIGALNTIQTSVKPAHSKTPSFQQNVLGNFETGRCPLNS
jgi:hypothetical protein